MTIAYLDTSALVKQYLTEGGSTWIRSLVSVSQPPQLFTSRLTVVEAACAFARRRREGAIAPEDYDQALEALDYDIAYRYNITDWLNALSQRISDLRDRLFIQLFLIDTADIILSENAHIHL